MILSFVISFFNAAVRDVNRCLDSIYDSVPEGLSLSEFEVVCVNDGSTLPEGVAAVEGYMHAGSHPENLILLHHAVNKRQGAGRNTAMQVAKGRYIQYLDIDDFMAEGAFEHIMTCIGRYEGVDVMRFDEHTADETGNIIQPGKSDDRHFPQVISGRDYALSNYIPPTVWQCLYRREYLEEQKLSFVERRFFEDTDYSMKAIIYAKRMVVVPFSTIVHTFNPYQTTKIGYSEVKICDFYYLYYRIGEVIGSVYDKDRELGDRLLATYSENMRRIMLGSHLWKLPYRRIREMLVKYPPVGGVKLPPVLAAMRRWPRAMAVAIAAVSPAIRLVYKLYILARR